MEEQEFRVVVINPNVNDGDDGEGEKKSLQRKTKEPIREKKKQKLKRKMKQRGKGKVSISKLPIVVSKVLLNMDRMLWLHVLCTALVTYYLTSRYASVDRCAHQQLPPRPLLPPQVSEQPNFLLTMGLKQATIPLLVRFVIFPPSTRASTEHGYRVRSLSGFGRWTLAGLLFYFILLDLLVYADVRDSLAEACDHGGQSFEADTVVTLLSVVYFLVWFVWTVMPPYPRAESLIDPRNEKPPIRQTFKLKLKRKMRQGMMKRKVLYLSTPIKSKLPIFVPKVLLNIDRMLWLHVLCTAFVTYDLTSRYASADRCPLAVTPGWLFFLPFQLSEQPKSLLKSGLVQAALPVFARFAFFRARTRTTTEHGYRVHSLSPFGRWTLTILLYVFVLWDIVLYSDVANSLARACRDPSAFGPSSYPLVLMGVVYSFFWFAWTPFSHPREPRSEREAREWKQEDRFWWREWVLKVAAIRARYHRRLRVRGQTWLYAKELASGWIKENIFGTQTKGETVKLKQKQMNYEPRPPRIVVHSLMQSTDHDGDESKKNENYKENKPNKMEKEKEMSLLWDFVFPYHLLWTAWFTYDLATRYACVGRGDLSLTSNSSSSDDVIVVRKYPDADEAFSTLDGVLSNWILPFEISNQTWALFAFGLAQATLPAAFVFLQPYLDDPKGLRDLRPRLTRTRRLVHWILAAFLVGNVLEFCAVHGSVGKACPHPEAFGTWYTTALVTVAYLATFLLLLVRPLTEAEVRAREQRWRLIDRYYRKLAGLRAWLRTKTTQELREQKRSCRKVTALFSEPPKTNTMPTLSRMARTAWWRIVSSVSPPLAE